MARLFLNLILFLVAINYVHSNIEVLTYETNEVVEEIDSYELSIGKEIPDAGIEGNVIVSEPEDACKKLQKPPKNDEGYKSLWFVLVDNGNCFSDIKFKNIKEAGYNGAIMYNTKPNGRRFLKENTADVEVDFPILFVTPVDGKKIKSSYTFDKRFYVRVNRKPDEEFVLIDNPKLMILIAAIVGVLALVFFGSAYFYRKFKKQPEEPEKRREN